MNSQYSTYDRHTGPETLKSRRQHTRSFIRNFNFASPDWDRLPDSFPNLDEEGLTRYEKYLLDGTKTAWFVGTAEGKTYLYKKVVKRLALSLSVAVILITVYLGTNLLLPENKTYSKPVEAATMSAKLKNLQVPTAQDIGNAVESTMSALLK